MKKYVLLLGLLTLVFILIAFKIKDEYFFVPYPNLIEYVLALVLLLVTGIALLWHRYRKQKALAGLVAVVLLLLTVNILNYYREWHPLNLALPFRSSQSFEVEYEPYEWPTDAPEKHGYPSEALATYFKNIDQWKRLRALLVIKDDKLIVEKYFADATPRSAYNVHSMTKSVTSALVGLAIQKGYLKSEHERALPFFSEYKTANSGPWKDSLRIVHLLAMRGGFSGGDGYQTVEQCLVNEKLGAKPGKKFKYFTGSQQLLSGILTKATKQPVNAFARQHLFKPLGIHQGFWRKVDGYYCGGGESYYTARDLARFGSLYLQNGKVDGQQILDSSWVQKSFINYSPERGKGFRQLTSYNEVGYGYCWWVLQHPKHSNLYAARGKGGQHILLLPDKNMIVVILQEWNLQKNEAIENKMIGDLLSLL